MLAWMGTDGLDDFANEQRIQIMRAVSAERVQVEALIDRQRGAVQAFVDGERNALLEQVRQERIAAMADAQKLADHATEEATRKAKEIIDHFLLRLGLVLGAVVVLAVVGVFLIRRRAAPVAAAVPLVRPRRGLAAAPAGKTLSPPPERHLRPLTPRPCPSGSPRRRYGGRGRREGVTPWPST